MILMNKNAQIQMIVVFVRKILETLPIWNFICKFIILFNKKDFKIHYCHKYLIKK